VVACCATLESSRAFIGCEGWAGPLLLSPPQPTCTSTPAAMTTVLMTVEDIMSLLFTVQARTPTGKVENKERSGDYC
jgi:hypothetical protein